MPSCLFLTPFPLVKPRHGGQVRAASVMLAARMAGWEVECIGIYMSALFPPDERGPHDIVLSSQGLTNRALRDIAFADFHIGRAAAEDPAAIMTLRSLIDRLAPDLIEVEHPWSWPLLCKALPDGRSPRIIYSSHNLEWRARLPLLGLGMRNTTSDKMIEAARQLETDFARDADLVFSISDIEQVEIEQASGREVVYLPAVANLAPDGQSTQDKRFADEARRASCRYAALMGSAYWPNMEGFFEIFSEGLGFLALGEQIWAAGDIGQAIRDDPRFGTFRSVNAPRLRAIGYVADEQKASFFDAAGCVIVPVTIGAGAKLKTADAIASGRPVIATPHGLEGYGPVVADALDRGVFLAESSADFRRLVCEALRNGLPGCGPEIRARLSLTAMAQTWGHHANALLSGSSLDSTALRPA